MVLLSAMESGSLLQWALQLYGDLCDATPLPNAVRDSYALLYELGRGHTHPTLFVSALSFSHHMLFFWLLCLPLLALDLTRRPAWLYGFKMQPAVPSIPALWKCVRGVLRNQLTLLLPVTMLLQTAYAWRGCGLSPASLPSVAEIAVDLLVCILVEEVLFYYVSEAMANEHQQCAVFRTCALTLAFL